MAAPIIDSIVASPNVISPGGSFQVTIVAHDPDERTVMLLGTVVDAGGSQTSAQVSLRISDPISFTLAGEPGFVITPKPGAPGVFDCVAP